MEMWRIGAGAAAGLLGGVLFGSMMHAMGMLGMVAGLVGQDAVAVGWLVHLVNSIIIGAIYGATFGRLAQGWGRGVGFGLAYGVLWWVLGGLIVMPLWLDMPALQVGDVQLQSLMGHLVYGLATGVGFVALAQRRTLSPAGREPTRA